MTPFPRLITLALILAGLSAHRSLAANQSQEPPSLTLLSPPVVYPEEKKGQRFSKITVRCPLLNHYNKKNPLTDPEQPLTVLIDGRKVDAVYDNEDNRQTATNTSLKKNGQSTYPRSVHLRWNGNDLDLFLPWQGWGIALGGYRGNLAISLQFGEKTSDSKDVLVSGVQWQYFPVTLASVATFALFAVIVLVVGCRQKTYQVADRKYQFLAPLFLEKDTNTYSLPLFQFYAWTGAAVFGYITLYIAQILIQGKFALPEIPGTLPGVIFFGAATAVTARGISNVRGPKGAGPIYPSMADFVSTGGLIVPERFQFFVWTIVGVSSFVFLILWTDPAKLTTLPQVSVEFLALMGVSSSGYLAGKIVRKPGPVIDSIDPTPRSLSLLVKGQKLSKDATFKIDDAEVKSPSVSYGEADDNSTPTEFYKELNISLSDPAPGATTGGRHRFKIINPDAQEAEWYYELPATPVLTSAKGTLSRADDAAELVITIEGAKLSEKAAFKIDGTDVQANTYKVLKGDPDEPGATTPTLFKRLVLTIKDPLPSWRVEGGHSLEVLNTTDLKAEKSFQITKVTAAKG